MRRKWEKEEINILKNNYEKYSKKRDLNLNNLEKILKRNKANICRKARKLGLTDRKRIWNKTIKIKLSETKKGHIPWNKGKKLPQISGKNNPFYGKKHTTEKRIIMSKRNKESYIGREHPKGFLGYKHTIKSRKKMSEKSLAAWRDPNSKMNTIESREKRAMISSKRMIKLMKEGWNPYSNAKGGKREDIGIYVRSKMEANYIRYLNIMKIKWEYEPKIFYFENVKRGTLTYTPDIYLTEEDKWIEIKGWFTKRAKTSLRRFKKYYFNEFKKLIIVIDDPLARTRANAEMMYFLNEIGIELERIESYKEIKNKLSKLIPNWE